MRVIRVALTNFRNYTHSSVDLSQGRNILIGENAQGKTNFLEAVELVSTGRSSRAQSDLDLIRSGQAEMKLEVVFETRGSEETIAMTLRPAGAQSRRSIEKQIFLNGLNQSMWKNVRGRLVTVGFRSSDLYLLRGGPKYRRDWMDTIIETLKPAYRDTTSKYQKVITQRNRLLKIFFEKGRITVGDQDELKVWDLQLAKLGANIIKHRMELLLDLLPKAEHFQEHISGRRESLSAAYILKANESEETGDQETIQLRSPDGGADPSRLCDQEQIGQLLLRQLKERRAEEMARRQTVVGPHRDDIRFSLNGLDAVDFASQGQQRSLVLSCKLAELESVTEMLSEPPVLMLDDVLAELDLARQGLLMSLVNNSMQTIITTTHLDGFKPEWLTDALFLTVENGAVRTSIADPVAAAAN